MMRAKLSFENAGFEVYAAPTGFAGIEPLSINSFVPNALSLYHSSHALHEWLGYFVYSMFKG